MIFWSKRRRRAHWRKKIMFQNGGKHSLRCSVFLPYYHYQHQDTHTDVAKLLEYITGTLLSCKCQLSAKKSLVASIDKLVRLSSVKMVRTKRVERVIPNSLFGPSCFCQSKASLHSVKLISVKKDCTSDWVLSRLYSWGAGEHHCFCSQLVWLAWCGKQTLCSVITLP